MTPQTKEGKIKLIEEKKLSPGEPCPYLKGLESRQEFFLAMEVTPNELDELLAFGFRKFGPYYFRPKCQGCQKCLPLRVLTDEFSPTKSQRRIWRKNQDLKVIHAPPMMSQEIIELYQKHSRLKFGKIEDDLAEFQFTHFTPSTRGFLTEFRWKDKLIALGFCDWGQSSLSSVYFIYDPEFEKRSLGHFGSLYEINWAKNQKLEYYYLGYWIEENQSMNYKANFHPHELLNWKQSTWIRVYRA